MRQPASGRVDRGRFSQWIGGSGQKFITFHGTKREAQDKLTDELSAVHRGVLPDMSRR